MASTPGPNKPLSPIECAYVAMKCRVLSPTPPFHFSAHSELQSATMHIIREVYEGQNAHETFEAELEKALKARVNYIIIEPERLGDETERWITVGNCLHKTAVLSGVVSMACGSVWTDKLTVSASFCALSVFCTGLYTVSWNYDPCCQYQSLHRHLDQGINLPNFEISSFSSPVVLVFTGNTTSKYMHRGVTLLAAAFCAWRIFDAYK